MTEEKVATATAKGINEKYCHECGATINIKAEICPKCGVRQSTAPNNSSTNTERSRVAAALFAIFLGCLGIHKFYLGRVGWGVVYILITCTIIGAFFTALISLIEGIVYLTMSDEAFNAKYSRKTK